MPEAGTVAAQEVQVGGPRQRIAAAPGSWDTTYWEVASVATSLPSPVASWRAPVWATSTTTIDGGVAYSCSRSVMGLTRHQDNGVTSLDVRLVQQDAVDIATIRCW